MGDNSLSVCIFSGGGLMLCFGVVIILIPSGMKNLCTMSVGGTQIN